MRKKSPAQSQVSVTPMRRSTRLQQERTAEKNEPQHPRSRTDDTLLVRESIKAYKKQVDPTKEPPDPPGIPSEPGAQQDVGQQAEKEKILLETPNIQWDMVKNRKSQLQELDPSKPQSGKVGHPEDTTTLSLQRPIETWREPRQETWTGITPRIKVPPVKKVETTKLPPKASSAKEVHQKWFKVKELGIALYNCSCLAKDLHRIFAMYRILGKEGASMPTSWPRDLAALSSLQEPRKVQLNGVEAQVYISISSACPDREGITIWSQGKQLVEMRGLGFTLRHVVTFRMQSSPPALCSTGRTSDLTAILSIIEDAREFVYISVMDYEPQCLYCKSKRFWPVIDDALRTAACDKGVSVRLLISCWQHSRQTMFVFLESLTVLRRKPLHCPIEVVRTSNWSEDYFLHTTGVGLIINQSHVAPEAQSYTLRQQLVDVFVRGLGLCVHSPP
ncbi:hypothetical protein Chor_005159 [Crotalus horridus]